MQANDLATRLRDHLRATGLFPEPGLAGLAVSGGPDSVGRRDLMVRVAREFGLGQAVVRVDVTVEPGKLTDATINHVAGKITLRLVNQRGGEALANTQWNILTPSGDIVKESAGALPSHILAPGSYTVLARHRGKDYTREFVVEPGETRQIEVVIQ